MNMLENFYGASIPAGFYWYNEPAQVQFGDGLTLATKANTDFWQRTHYGFRRDDGHCLLTKVAGDFAVITHVEFAPATQYDQGGLMIRADAQNWIKMSTEYETTQISRLGSVVTNLGYSDWATQDIPSTHRAMWYRISKRGQDFLLEHSFDGDVWHQLRMTHLHTSPEFLEVGVYACSPLGELFRCTFKTLQIRENTWCDAAH